MAAKDMECEECDKGFSNNYMLLKPQEVKFLDLFRILFSTKIRKSEGVDSSQEKEQSFKHRWLIFVSIVVQKVLQFSSGLLSALGRLFEKWLNLLSANGNLGRLLLNLVRGKLIIPDDKSAEFISFIGNFDTRIELDKNIKHGDPRYVAALAMMASKASYENEAYIKSIVEDRWKMEFLKTSDYWNDYQGKPSTQAFLLRDRTEGQDTVVVAFRGTEPFNADDWCSDFDISWYELHEKPSTRTIGKIHGGFMKALGLQKCRGWPKEVQEDPERLLAYYAIRATLREILSENDEAKFILTGHSLGGALAILFTAVLAFHDEELLLKRLEGVYTFGQPRVGDEKFGKYMEEKLSENAIRYYRFVYSNDMVPRLPYDDSALMFKHFGTCIYYNRHYQGKVVQEEPNKNYFSPLRGIPMIFNAFMELIRSFTILYAKGPEYRENWLLTLFRIVGLVVPGMPPHSPQDYVNSTRLGSADVFLPPQETRVQIDRSNPRSGLIPN